MMIDDAQLLQVKATIWAAAYAVWLPYCLQRGSDYDEANDEAERWADTAVAAFCAVEDVA